MSGISPYAAASAIVPSRQELTETIRSLQKADNLYGLFALEVPKADQTEKLLALYKTAMKTTLQTYTFVNFHPLHSEEEGKYAMGRHCLIKLIGANYREIQRIGKALDQTSINIDVSLLEVYKEASSPYGGFEEMNVFPITQLAARTLCQVIQETPEIDALIFISLPKLDSTKGEPSQKERSLLAEHSFGDNIAQILAENLPRDRFKMLRIGGGFSAVGSQVLLKNLPSLLSPAPLDPKDVSTCGLLSDGAFAETQIASYFGQRRAKNPESLLDKPDPERCAIM